MRYQIVIIILTGNNTNLSEMNNNIYEINNKTLDESSNKNLSERNNKCMSKEITNNIYNQDIIDKSTISNNLICKPTDLIMNTIFNFTQSSNKNNIKQDIKSINNINEVIINIEWKK